MSINFSKIYGNDLLKSLLGENIRTNKLPHAMILEGLWGSGRYTLALHIAAASLCVSDDKPCYSCKNCRQIFSSTAPDVVTVSLPEDKSTISVEAVRLIKNDAAKVPVEGDLKFYIIRDADKMTVQAQNALLKILEEPPSFVVFILISENSNLLLSTIRSRAPVFRMQRFDDDVLKDYILENCMGALRLNDSDPLLLTRIIKSSNGSIGAAMFNLNGSSVKDALKSTEYVTQMFTALCGTHKADFVRFEEELPTKRDEFRNGLFIVRSAIRDVLSVKKGGTKGLIFFESADSPKKYAKTLTLGSLVELLEITEATLKLNEQNANINLLKINYMNSLWKCVH